MVGKAKKSTHGKKASSKALAKRRSSKAPAQKKRVEIDETVRDNPDFHSNQWSTDRPVQIGPRSKWSWFDLQLFSKNDLT